MPEADTQFGIPNPVLTRLADGEPAIGLGVQLSRSAEIAFIAKDTGHDFIWIDAQHGLFDLETIRHLALAALGVGVAPVVRVRGFDDPITPQLLDSGVTGIVFPDVESVEQARHAVATARFPPTGSRSVAGAYPQFGYRRISPAEAMTALDESTLVVCMIESRAGLEAVEGIAAVDGVDVVHLGMSDMLRSMGKPGAHGDREIMAALDQVIAAAKAAGKHAGVGGNRNVSAQVESLRKGVRFMTTHTDLGLVAAGASEWINAVRAGLSAGASGVS